MRIFGKKIKDINPMFKIRLRSLASGKPFVEQEILIHYFKSRSRNPCENEWLIYLCCDTALLFKHKMQLRSQFWIFPQWQNI